MVFVIFISIISILVAMIVHEFSHGFVAYLLGDKTAKREGRLTLNPIAHLDPYISIILPILCVFSNLPVIGGAKPVPVDSRELKWGKWGMALVALAGPLSNFIMALISFTIMHALNLSHGDIAAIFGRFTLINLSLAIFNLIPIPPLDGSKILQPFAPEFVQDFFDRPESYGSIFILALMFLFSTVISNYINFSMSLILEGFSAFLRIFGL